MRIDSFSEALRAVEARAEPWPVTIVLLAWNYPGEFAARMRVNLEGRGDQVIHVRPDTDADM